MRDSDTTLIDHESAVKAYEALDEITANGLKNALANVLARKLERSSLPLPTGDRVTDKFERFFDVLFDVGYEHKPLPVERMIELVEEAAAGYRKDAQEDRETIHADPDDDNSVHYEEDASAYDEVADLLRMGDLKGAAKLYERMDTYTRGRLFSNNAREQFQLEVFLHQNGYRA